MTSSSKRCLSALLGSLLLGLSAPLAAQDPSAAPEEKPKLTIEKAQELMRAMGSGGQDGEAKRDEIRKVLASDPTIDPEFAKRFLKHFDIEKLDREIAKLYVDEYSPELAGECLRFFQGEVGKRWVALNRELAPIRAEQSQRMAREIGQRIRKGEPPVKRKPRPKPEPGSLSEKLEQVLVATRARDLLELPMKQQIEEMRASGMPASRIELVRSHMDTEIVLDRMRDDLLARVDQKLLDGVLEFHASKAGKASMERLLRILPKTQKVSEAIAMEAAEKALRGGE